MMIGIVPSMLAASVVLTPVQPYEISSSTRQCARHDRPRPPYASGSSQFMRPGLPGLLADVGGERAVLVQLAGDRDDLLARELPRGVDQLLLLVGELEIGHAAL